MDYEKKYKEALERVRRLHDRMLVLSSTDALVASSELEFIFPELTEIEDERIRKELIEAFEAYDIESKWNGIPIRSIFAWLEKQKEQKHDATDAKSERVIKAARSVLNNWLDGTDCPDVSGDFAELEYAIREYDGEERQKERVPENEETGTRKEQKPAECIEDSVKFEEGFKAGRESGLRDGQKYVLNNLDSYGLCKPAEWSEEDKRKLNRIYEILGQAAEEKPFGSSKRIIGDKEAVELQDFIKLLSRSWKPSEEQMKALTEEEKPKEETPVEKERKRLEGNLKEEVCASDICAYRGKNVCTIKRDEYCPIFKPNKEDEK